MPWTCTAIGRQRKNFPIVCGQTRDLLQTWWKARSNTAGCPRFSTFRWHVGTTTPHTLCAFRGALAINGSQTTLLINDSQTIKQGAITWILWSVCHCLPRSPILTGVCPPKALGYLNLHGRGILFSIDMKYHLDFFHASYFGGNLWHF